MRLVPGWVVAGLLAAGCVSTPPVIGSPPPVVGSVQEEQSFREELSRCTARAELYRGFDTILFTSATFQTPTFREVRVRRLGAFQSQMSWQISEALEREKQEASRMHTVFLGVHANESRYDDFGRPNSMWKVSLVAPDGEVLPTRIERVGRANVTLRAVYPYMGDFWVGYRVEFPLTRPDGKLTVPPEAKEIILRMASTLGTVEMPLGVR